jgi:hypothetical protein
MAHPIADGMAMLAQAHPSHTPGANSRRFAVLATLARFVAHTPAGDTTYTSQISRSCASRALQRAGRSWFAGPIPVPARSKPRAPPTARETGQVGFIVQPTEGRLHPPPAASDELPLVGIAPEPPVPVRAGYKARRPDETLHHIVSFFQQVSAS